MATIPTRVYTIALNASSGEKGRGLARVEVRNDHGSIEVSAAYLEPHGNGAYHVIVIAENGLVNAGELRPNAQGYHLKAPLGGIRSEVRGVLIVFISQRGNLRVVLSGLARGQKSITLQMAEEQARIRWGMGMHSPLRTRPAPSVPERHVPASTPLEQQPSERIHMAQEAEPVDNTLPARETAPAASHGEDDDMKIWGKVTAVSATWEKMADEVCAPIQEHAAASADAPQPGDDIAVSAMPAMEEEIPASVMIQPEEAVETAANTPLQGDDIAAGAMSAMEEEVPASAMIQPEEAAETAARPYEAHAQRHAANSRAPFPAYPVPDGDEARYTYNPRAIGDDRLGRIILDNQLMPEPPIDSDILMERDRQRKQRGSYMRGQDGETPARMMDEDWAENRDVKYEDRKEGRQAQDPFERLRCGRPANRQQIQNPFPQLYPRTRWVMVQYPGMYTPHYLASELTLNGRRLWAAAVPGEFDTTPPPWLPGFIHFRRAYTGQGYWVALQDPDTGEFYNDER